jgi:two-component system chemotaxis sensor kinase CheA
VESNNELLGEFVQEAEAHIAQVEAGLLQMENDECDADTINTIFRAVHSIKGTAGFFELKKIVELSHSMENLFGALRDQKVSVGKKMVDTLLTATDLLKELICSLPDNENFDIVEQVAAVRSFLPQEKKTEVSAPAQASAWDLWNQLTETTADTEKNEGKASVPAEKEPSDVADEASSVWAMWDQITAEKPAEAEKGEAAVNVTPPLLSDTVPPAGLPEDKRQAKPDDKKKASIAGESVRVSVELLNDLMNIVGEMVLRRNQLLRISQNAGREVPNLDTVAQSMDNLTTSLQEKVMKTRMQPIANVFNKFPRIVRELSHKMEKEVELILEGLNVELDRSIIESMLDPLTHLVRNALDHGIEAPAVRIGKNKPSSGTLKMHAYHESGRVILDISDDGAGIDAEKVKAKAIAKGLASEKEMAMMREMEILGFIMRPGFSTAERITDISGRGVGMDVVKTNIEKLGGKVEIHTELGAGTTFRLILPLTLAIISSFIVETGEDVFAVPQTNVKELVLIQPGRQQGKRIEFIHGAPVLRLRKQLLPLFYLGDVFETTTITSGQVNHNEEYFLNPETTFRILVIKSGSLRYGLAVDAVYDTEEILVKPVPSVLKAGGCYSGVTVLGDGRIAMIIDTESIRTEANLCAFEEAMVQAGAGQEETVSKSGEEQYILLFKGSGNELLGLDLAMVSRIEEVKAEQIQQIGDKSYLAFRGQTIRVIRPECYLPINKRETQVEKVYVIMPKLVKHPVGIIAEEIHDAVLINIRLDASGVSGKGVLGSTIVDGTIVTLLNMYELFEAAVPEYYGQAAFRQSKGQTTETADRAEGGKPVVLLAEDTPFFLKLAQSYLESGGYEVITAVDGRKALDILLTTKVDLVVSDIEMPNMTGLELVRAIRANEKLRHLPVIALTSLTSDADKEKGLRAGFDIYEFKMDRARLLDSVANVLHRENLAVKGGA